MLARRATADQQPTRGSHRCSGPRGPAGGRTDSDGGSRAGAEFSSLLLGRACFWMDLLVLRRYGLE